MAEGQAACAICHIRRPRRYCPGVGGDICPVCCGTERENTVNCPLDCQYLREARARERDPEVDPHDFPNQDIRVDEQFLHRNEPLLLLVASEFAKAALEQEREHAIDSDVRDAIAALLSTYRALDSGLYYSVTLQNPIAEKIRDRVHARLVEVEDLLSKNSSVLRNVDVLGVLAFLQRLEIQKNNRRSKSRAFIDFLREFFPTEPPPEPEQTSSSSLILP
jgi:hypothetical protein